MSSSEQPAGPATREGALRPRVTVAVTATLGIVAALLVLLIPGAASAQIGSAPLPRDARFDNSIGLAVSYGHFIGRDAVFWGVAVDYTRRLRHGWSVGGSLAYDRDIETLEDGAKKEVQALNAVAVVNYSFNIFTLTTGLSKGFAGDGREPGRLEFANGDWGTGIVFGVALPDLPWTERDTLAFSVGYEYNLSQNEPDISFDLGIGFAF